MNEYTTIRIKKTTRDRLKTHGKMGEDMEIALDRLLNLYEEQMK